MKCSKCFTEYKPKQVEFNGSKFGKYCCDSCLRSTAKLCASCNIQYENVDYNFRRFAQELCDSCLKEFAKNKPNTTLAKLVRIALPICIGLTILGFIIIFNGCGYVNAVRADRPVDDFSSVSRFFGRIVDAMGIFVVLFLILPIVGAGFSIKRIINNCPKCDNKMDYDSSFSGGGNERLVITGSDGKYTGKIESDRVSESRSNYNCGKCGYKKE
ncbi:MAG: hypothetical protein FWE03_04370 [Firmicutes bacterium]|nr:hypothetical protein [Bacillota bacterium]